MDFTRLTLVRVLWPVILTTLLRLSAGEISLLRGATAEAAAIGRTTTRKAIESNKTKFDPSLASGEDDTASYVEERGKTSATHSFLRRTIIKKNARRIKRLLRAFLPSPSTVRGQILFVRKRRLITVGIYLIDNSNEKK